MPAPTTTSAFLEMVRKSQLVNPEHFETYLQELLNSGELTEDPSRTGQLCARDGLLTPFQVEQLLQGKWRGFAINKYRVLERLGIGQSSCVYLGEHSLLCRLVALKVLPISVREKPGKVDRLYREHRALQDLCHPNIVRCYDLDRDGGLDYLVLEYIDGATLQEVVERSGPLSLTQAAHYVRQAALALQHLWEEAVMVHGDVSPENIMVSREGIVRLIDFGLVHFLEEDMPLSGVDDVVSNCDRVSPEFARDYPDIDCRSDIYSLGCTLYFLLSGNPPFPESTTAQKLLWHQSREPQAIVSYRSDIPDPLNDVLGKMMAKDRDQRYQTAGEVVAALSPWTDKPLEPPSETEIPPLCPALRIRGKQPHVRSEH